MKLTHHFKTLEKIRHERQMEIGRRPARWAKNVYGNAFDFEDSAQSRKTVRTFCEDPDYDTIKCVLRICAWGGMNEKHGISFFNKIAERGSALNKALHDVRGSGKDRKEDFRLLQSLRKSGDMPGMDIAYFTKLLFFLRADSDAYIMDRWTAKSINLLYGDTVEMYGDYVSPKNDEHVYEDFCAKVEHLAVKLGGIPPDEAEERIFSRGWPKRGEWRTYLKNPQNGLKP